MPKRVTLKIYLEARLLQVGEELTYPSKGHIHRGQLNRNGSVVYQGMNFKPHPLGQINWLVCKLTGGNMLLHGDRS